MRQMKAAWAWIIHMNLKFFGIIILSALMFVLGFFLGGFNWGWADKNYSGEVALWSMLGGWLSGIATLLAVLVSLYMAYQATQNENEKIRVTHGVSVDVTHGKGVSCNIIIQNMRNMRVNITGVFFSLGKSSGKFSLDKVIGHRDITLSYKGETEKIQFIIDSGVVWWSTYTLFDMDKNIDFKKGKLFITTNLNTYEFDLPKAYLEAFEDAYSRYQTTIK
ncbi:hypothetical protein LY009_004255 [Salmonella enterica]|nr:hypothetical protein [Salmonella enterica]EIS0288698.1 hypothetical protein [Salmonella enterica]